ncbi:TetR family transcriptional regulator, partial [Campylobacter jejuni]
GLCILNMPGLDIAASDNHIHRLITLELFSPLSPGGRCSQ